MAKIMEGASLRYVTVDPVAMGTTNDKVTPSTPVTQVSGSKVSTIDRTGAPTGLGTTTYTTYDLTQTKLLEVQEYAEGLPIPIFEGGVTWPDATKPSKPGDINADIGGPGNNYLGYKHFADEIGETTNLHWFTQDERELLISLYNKMKEGFEVSISPESRVLCWTVQPDSFSGKQKLPIRCPFDGTIVGFSAACSDWGRSSVTVVLQKAKEADFNNGLTEDMWDTVTPLILQWDQNTPNNRSLFMAVPDPVECSFGDLYDVKVMTDFGVLGITTPVTIQLYIKLKDQSTTVKGDIDIDFDPNDILNKKN